MGCQTTYSCPITIPSSLPTPGEDGTDGISPHIGDNGNWYLDTTDTGVKAAGTDGADGAAGEDGSAVICNTMGVLHTSSIVGTVSLVSYSIPAGTLSVGDILDIETFIYGDGFVGTVQLKFGTALVINVVFPELTTITAGLPAEPPPDEALTGDTVTRLRSRVYIETSNSEYVTGEKMFYYNPILSINTYPSLKAENTANAILVDLRVINVSGTLQSDSLIIIHHKKV